MEVKTIIEYEFLQYFKNGEMVDGKALIADFRFVEYIYHDFHANKRQKDFDNFLEDLYTKGTATIVGLDTNIKVRCIFAEVLE